MNFRLSLTVDTDWDKPDGYMEHEFSVGTWKEAKEYARSVIAYNPEDMESALNGEFDYNWCINSEYTQWPEAASLLREYHPRYDQTAPALTATLEVLPEQREQINISDMYHEQNKKLSATVNEAKERTKLAELQAKYNQ